MGLRKLCVLAAASVFVTLGTAQTFQRLGTCPTFGCVFPPDQCASLSLHWLFHRAPC